MVVAVTALGMMQVALDQVVNVIVAQVCLASAACSAKAALASK